MEQRLEYERTKRMIVRPYFCLHIVIAKYQTGAEVPASVVNTTQTRPVNYGDIMSLCPRVRTLRTDSAKLCCCCFSNSTMLGHNSLGLSFWSTNPYFLALRYFLASLRLHWNRVGGELIHGGRALSNQTSIPNGELLSRRVSTVLSKLFLMCAKCCFFASKQQLYFSSSHAMNRAYNNSAARLLKKRGINFASLFASSSVRSSFFPTSQSLLPPRSYVCIGFGTVPSRRHQAERRSAHQQGGEKR